MSTPFPSPLSARVEARLNVRATPTTLANRVGRLLPGAAIVVDRWVSGSEVLGNDCWYGLLGLEQYVWSGGVRLAEAVPGTSPAPLSPAVPPAAVASPAIAPSRLRRRANGSILPLTEQQLIQHYGDPGRQAGAKRGLLVPPAAWRTQLQPFAHPALNMVAQLQVHQQALPYFTAAFDEILNQGLDRLILSCEGSWVPRHIGWDPAKPLSSHAFGVAIDLNGRWNGQNFEPALPGKTGCLRELVPIFNAHGFAWGGHFSRLDGMHFELALDPP